MNEPTLAGLAAQALDRGDWNEGCRLGQQISTRLAPDINLPLTLPSVHPHSIQTSRRPAGCSARRSSKWNVRPRH